MRLDRYLAGFVLSKMQAAEDLCAIAEERDAWKARALEAERARSEAETIADAAVLRAERYFDALRDYQLSYESGVAW